MKWLSSIFPARNWKLLYNKIMLNFVHKLSFEEIPYFDTYKPHTITVIRGFFAGKHFHYHNAVK